MRTSLSSVQLVGFKPHSTSFVVPAPKFDCTFLLSLLSAMSTTVASFKLLFQLGLRRAAEAVACGPKFGSELSPLPQSNRRFS